MFPQDNNGLAIVLPQVVATGSAALTGSMIFGIGTQSNNALNGAVAIATDRRGSFTTTFNGKPYPGSFIDSGSNGYYFLDSAPSDCPRAPAFSSTSIARRRLRISAPSTAVLILTDPVFPFPRMLRSLSGTGRPFEFSYTLAAESSSQDGI